jgi:hypothetical protein
MIELNKKHQTQISMSMNAEECEFQSTKKFPSTQNHPLNSET